MPSKHAKLPPSSAERWINCPGSVALAEQLPPPGSSPYADEGTLAHAVAELKLRKIIGEITPKKFDKDLAKRLRTSLKKKGINFHTGAAAKRIEGGTVYFEEKGKEASVEADLILMAVGRAAHVKALNLDDLGIQYTPRGIVVDEHMQTNVPGIYAVGDVNGLCQLAHAATFQGYTALDHILQQDHGYVQSLKIIPAAVFTHPEAAMVGDTEEALTAKGKTYKTYKAFYRSNGKALAMNEEDGIVKVLVDEGSDEILGTHILGAHASDLIHEISTMMRNHVPFHALRQAVHAHPSLSEIFLSLK